MCITCTFTPYSLDPFCIAVIFFVRLWKQRAPPTRWTGAAGWEASEKYSGKRPQTVCVCEDNVMIMLSVMMMMRRRMMNLQEWWVVVTMQVFGIWVIILDTQKLSKQNINNMIQAAPWGIMGICVTNICLSPFTSISLFFPMVSASNWIILHGSPWSMSIEVSIYVKDKAHAFFLRFIDQISPIECT